VNNHVLSKLLDVFHAIYRNLRDRSLLVTRDPLVEVENHESILGAIEARNVDQARQLMEHHFMGIKQRISTATTTAGAARGGPAT
jgi:DNA-binding GntR family transcriptional regulator